MREQCLFYSCWSVGAFGRGKIEELLFKGLRCPPMKLHSDALSKEMDEANAADFEIIAQATTRIRARIMEEQVDRDKLLDVLEMTNDQVK